MADPIRVEAADLLGSGGKLAEHAEEVQAVHTAADSRIAGALPSWTGLSQAAMAAKAVQWQAATTALSLRLSDHATALTESADAYDRTETHNAGSLNEVGPSVAPTAL